MSLEHKYLKYKNKYFSLKNSLNKSVILSQHGGVIQEYFTFADGTYNITDDGTIFYVGGLNRIDNMCSLVFIRNGVRYIETDIVDNLNENIYIINALPQEIKPLFIDYCNRVIAAVTLKIADQGNDWLPPFRNIWVVRINILQALLAPLLNNNNF